MDTSADASAFELGNLPVRPLCAMLKLMGLALPKSYSRVQPRVAR
jgi:hypothetical protein